MELIIYGESAGDRDVGIYPREFTLHTGFEIDADTKEWLESKYKGFKNYRHFLAFSLVKIMNELHDNGNIRVWFSDEKEEDFYIFTYKDFK